jgi:hypothetical protein
MSVRFKLRLVAIATIMRRSGFDNGERSTVSNPSQTLSWWTSSLSS